MHWAEDLQKSHTEKAPYGATMWASYRRPSLSCSWDMAPQLLSDSPQLSRSCEGISGKLQAQDVGLPRLG